MSCFLPKVLAAVAEVRSKINLSEWAMTATGFYHIPFGDTGLAGIVIEPTEELLALQRAVTEAVNAYARTGGGESAFVPDRTGTPFDPFLFEYVETFVPRQTGERFNPHLKIGVAPLGWLEKLEQKPFDKFTFSTDEIAT